LVGLLITEETAPNWYFTADQAVRGRPASHQRVPKTWLIFVWTMMIKGFDACKRSKSDHSYGSTVTCVNRNWWLLGSKSTLFKGI